ncbi:hypothetical protein Pint_27165 [Pistacia integerrima]|uniref:Uncharacterized protein n=1 Tax=Pistacia integerrima TaxID=434235 RepID=A0ACC0YVQ2_9ROSI|nr:hypothetical protein Pint_27165 [Pistacia integerrima]
MAPKPKASQGLALPKFKSWPTVSSQQVVALQPGVATTMPKTFSTLARFFQKAYSSVLNWNKADNKLEKADEEVELLKMDLVAPWTLFKLERNSWSARLNEKSKLVSILSKEVHNYQMKLQHSQKVEPNVVEESRAKEATGEQRVEEAVGESKVKEVARELRVEEATGWTLWLGLEER